MLSLNVMDTMILNVKLTLNKKEAIKKAVQFPIPPIYICPVRKFNKLFWNGKQKKINSI